MATLQVSFYFPKPQFPHLFNEEKDHTILSATSTSDMLKPCGQANVTAAEKDSIF